MRNSKPPAGDNAVKIEDAELLVELEQSTPDAIKAARAHTRITVRAQVTVQPGNMSDRLSMKVRGVSGDVSAGGCQLLFPVPLRVGDIYWLTFDRQTLDIQPVYARCTRCRVVREDAFEAGMAFFSPIELPTLKPERNGTADAPLI